MEAYERYVVLWVQVMAVRQLRMLRVHPDQRSIECIRHVLALAPNRWHSDTGAYFHNHQAYIICMPKVKVAALPSVRE